VSVNCFNRYILELNAPTSKRISKNNKQADIIDAEIIVVANHLIFRAWFYFRQGWSIYFAFIFAALNTMVTTYYLAIEKMPTLKQVFPSFGVYIITIAGIAIPILIVIGYVHVKRSKAYKAEIDVQFEVNPYFKKILLNSEEILRQQSVMSAVMIKLITDEKLTEEEIGILSKVQSQIEKNVSEKAFKRLDLDPNDHFKPLN